MKWENTKGLRGPVFISILPLLIALALVIYCGTQHPVSCGQNKEEVALSPILLADPASRTSVENKQRAAAQPSQICPAPCLLVSRTLENPVALFTAMLFYVVYLQLFWMTRQQAVLRGSLAAATRAAHAATTQADAALSIELPKFVIVDVAIWGAPVLTPDYTVFTVTVTLRNHGRTPAFVTRDCLTCKITQWLEDAPHYPVDSERASDFGIVVKENDICEVKREYQIANSEIELIDRKQSALWMYGYIAYRDFLDANHVAGFVAGFESRAPGLEGRFVQQGPADYTYSRREEAPLALR